MFPEHKESNYFRANFLEKLKPKKQSQTCQLTRKIHSYTQYCLTTFKS